MTREDVLFMAQECNLIGMRPHLDGIYQKSLERFAALVAAAEREACAKMADDHERQRCEAWAKVLTTGGEVPSASLSAVADAIRARGETK